MYEVMIDRFVAGGTSKAGPNGAPTDPAGDWKGGDFGGVTAEDQRRLLRRHGRQHPLAQLTGPRHRALRDGGRARTPGTACPATTRTSRIASGWTYGSENDPLFTSNGITNPIEPHFGEAADLNALVNAAHQHGIRVLTDLVVNHVFADSSPPIPPDRAARPAVDRAPVGPGVVQRSLQRQRQRLRLQREPLGHADTLNSSDEFNNTWNRADCWFDPYLPDFNTTNPTVNDAVANHAVWLMEQFNLDGFRVDAVKQVMNDVCVDLRSKISAAISTNLPFYMVGEALGGVQAQRLRLRGRRHAQRLDGRPDAQHDRRDHPAERRQRQAPGPLQRRRGRRGPSWTGSVPGALMGHFFGSHDTPRAISLAAGDSNGNPWSGAPPRKRPTRARPSVTCSSPTRSCSPTTRSPSSGWATSSDSPARSTPTAGA